MELKYFDNHSWEDRSGMFDDYFNDFESDYPHLKSIEKILEDSSEIGYDSDSDRVNENEDDVATNFQRSQSKYKLITKRIDFPKIHHKKDTGFTVNVSTCRRLNLSAEGNIRSGAIIYTHYQGQTYFCMGVDTDYGDLTDFAGGVKKTDIDADGVPSVITGGLRELREESLGVFGELNPEDVADDVVFWSSNMAIMFIRLDVIPVEVDQEFQKRFSDHPDKKNLEVSSVRWLNTEDFRDAILSRGQRMYSRVRKILCRVTHIIEAL